MRTWVEVRLGILYDDAQPVDISEIINVECRRNNPEAELIAIEERALVWRLANEFLQHSQASAIRVLLAGDAKSQTAAAHAVGLTGVQLCRAIKRLAHIYAAHTT